MSTATQTTVTTGQRAQLIAGPGFSTETIVEVQSIEGRTLVAQDVNHTHLRPVTYTLRNNGNWAQKGEGQWSAYLRFVSAK